MVKAAVTVTERPAEWGRLMRREAPPAVPVVVATAAEGIAAPSAGPAATVPGGPMRATPSTFFFVVAFFGVVFFFVSQVKHVATLLLQTCVADRHSPKGKAK